MIAPLKVPIMGLFFCYTPLKIKRQAAPIKERRIAVDYNIVWVRGHVEVYDWAGRFCFSADNEREAREELEGAA